MKEELPSELEKGDNAGASLAAQWLGTCLSLQGKQVSSPQATKQLGPQSHNYLSLEPVLRSRRSRRSEKPAYRK